MFFLKHYNTTERFQICYLTTSVLSYLVANPTKWPESAPISRNNVMNEIIKVKFTCIIFYNEQSYIDYKIVGYYTGSRNSIYKRIRIFS